MRQGSVIGGRIIERWRDKVEGNARRERWFGAASEFVFGLLGIGDGIDMHEFIETAGGTKTD
jgi:hypothetical protein